MIGTYEHVTEAWGKIHQAHPDVHKIYHPEFISRLKTKDFQRFIAQICNPSDGLLILEAGCGSGRDSLYLSHLGARCVALDYYFTPLKNLFDAKNKYKHAANSESLNLSIMAGDIFSLPFKDNTFDIVFNSGVIEHYDYYTRLKHLEEMVRVARIGGFVCVKLPNRYHFMDSVWQELISRYSDHSKYEIPEQLISVKEIEQEMNSCGLHMIMSDYTDACDTISLYPNWLPLRLLANLACAVLPKPPRFLRQKLGTRILAIGKKS